ncbi:hypothetical protein H5410_028774 [Solanum commersonii]|uniref:Uncharacterized protein n=1 Tax=Solanum commersonii TaxID=4109 RepID=A0A9J5Z3M2_SOLCO|nr:hypothetical protein H5410_028774 [Solanum commersonii]
MENGDSNFSNTDDALIFGSADISVGNASMISGPNISPPPAVEIVVLRGDFGDEME